MIINKNWATLQYLNRDGVMRDYSDRYIINKKGTLLNLNRYTNLQPWLVKGSSVSYMGFQIHDHEGVQRRLRLHRALLSSFYPLGDDNGAGFGFLDAAHIDGNPLNNDLNNLCWMSTAHNTLQVYRKGDVLMDPVTHVGVFMPPVEVMANV